ncbi:unnamed protein product [Sphagnum balticum]
MAMVRAVLGFKELQQCCSSSSNKSAAGLLIHFSKAHHTSISRHLSQGLLRVQQSQRKGSDLLISASAKKHVKEGGRQTRLLSMGILPVLATVVVTRGPSEFYHGTEFVDVYNDWQPSVQSMKDLYMLLAIVFCWGCCVFGSMKDPFYDSDEYRKDGGNGTQFWIYNRQEVDEEEAREELLREELVKEIEDKVGELRELEDADKEKETELV